jgi:hypothetical protein
MLYLHFCAFMHASQIRLCTHIISTSRNGVIALHLAVRAMVLVTVALYLTSHYVGQLCLRRARPDPYAVTHSNCARHPSHQHRGYLRLCYISCDPHQLLTPTSMFHNEGPFALNTPHKRQVRCSANSLSPNCLQVQIAE